MNCDPEKAAIELHQPQPLLVVKGELSNPTECYLVAEKNIDIEELKSVMLLLHY